MKVGAEPEVLFAAGPFALGPTPTIPRRSSREGSSALPIP